MTFRLYIPFNTILLCMYSKYYASGTEHPNPGVVSSE